MTQILYALRQAMSTLWGMISALDWRNALDIAIVSFFIYQIIKVVRRTRANSVLKGLAFILILTWLSGLMQLSALNWLLLQVIGTGVIMVVVLFQPELRRGLERIGRSRFKDAFLASDRGVPAAEHDAQELVQAMTNLARRRVGALVVLEGRTGMRDIATSGTTIDAEISAALIENIFEPNTPLHDGALIVRNGRIEAAGCVLPLSDSSAISRELGTRHRAAIGISESTDAVALIVSEETGIISVAKEGRLSRYLDAKTMHAMLMELFSPELPSATRTLLSGVWRKGERKDAR